jgi:hypothetical protein
MAPRQGNFNGAGSPEKVQRGSRIGIFSMLDPVNENPLRSVVDPIEKAIISNPDTISFFTR